jgi:hypothetical protein
MRRQLASALMIAALGLTGAGASAAEKAATKHATPKYAREPKVVRDQGTIDALEKMGAALRAKTDANLRTTFTAEDVLMSGQKLQYGGSIDLAARRPNMMKVVLHMGTADREIYFDGKTQTLASPSLGFYASSEAPPTIREFVANASKTMGIEIPLADLFMFGEDPTLTQRIISAFPAGQETVGGQVCNHYAIRQQEIDWQVWIRASGDALPCKIVITEKDDPAMPQFSATYDWLSEPPPPAGAAYTYTPASGANRITFGTIPAALPTKGDAK